MVKAKGKAGRPTKLNPELQEKMRQFMLASNYFETVCWGVGITPQTGYNWLNHGEKEESGIYHDFWETIKRAEAEAEIADIAYIKAGKANWQARAWIRERRNVNRWGRKEHQEVGGKDGQPIAVEVDIKGKLISKLNSIAAQAGEGESHQGSELKGSCGSFL